MAGIWNEMKAEGLKWLLLLILILVLLLFNYCQSVF